MREIRFTSVCRRNTLVDPTHIFAHDGLREEPTAETNPRIEQKGRKGNLLTTTPSNNSLFMRLCDFCKTVPDQYRAINGAEAARFAVLLPPLRADIRKLLL